MSFASYTRRIEKELLDWKKSPTRKPLLLRGARQVGKTTVVEAFGKNYAQYISLNLENEEDGNLFREINDIDKLVDAMFFLKEKTLDEKDTLLFIDEIQAVPEAINQLRYFYEKVSWLHVIAAGSLLETLLDEKVRIPVGRVEYKVVRPVSFAEYLGAIGEHKLLEQWEKVPMNDYAFQRLLDAFHTYTLIGGMPEIVQHYAEYGDLIKLAPIYESLTESYRNDVEKYARNSTLVQVIRHAIDSLPLQAGHRIKFEGFGNSNYGSREMGEALRMLERAMLLHLLYPTTQTDWPLMPDKKKSPRLQMLDTGLMNFYTGLQPQLILVKDLNNVYQGKVIEHIVGQEILAAENALHYKPQWWTREKKDSMAEVDFLVSVQGIIIPVEVKSGATGTLRSLLLLMDLLPHPFAVRLYAGALKIDSIKTPLGKTFHLLNLPYFLAGKIKEYVEWMMGEVK
jgi:predicted AAA+ superfamily ATPase